ncbi:MAG TPA: acyl-CoA dehydrogenase family protein [Acidimicrobiales bacterium]|nr:acyl-CoA dehydrogenase family protein [Acidimicrobiales bacterium]
MVAAEPEAVARQLAEDLLFPAALDVDASDSVPTTHLDALARAGLYGLAGPPETGGLAATPLRLWRTVELLASGCLATTFVWLQHHSLVRSLAYDPDVRIPDRTGWLQELCLGRRRAGIALAGLHPGPASLTARRSEQGGWVLDGSAQWVTGWGLVDVLQVVARGPGDTTVWCLVDAAESAFLGADRQRLVAADASRTVRLRFNDLAVTADRVLKVAAYSPDAWTGGAGLRTNGSLALGVASRCCGLLGPSRLDAELASVRDGLDSAADAEMGDARAAASELAVRAAAALTTATGSRSMLVGNHAERLARESLFLLVFGSRPSIKGSILRKLGA